MSVVRLTGLGTHIISCVNIGSLSNQKSSNVQCILKCRVMQRSAALLIKDAHIVKISTNEMTVCGKAQIRLLSMEL